MFEDLNGFKEIKTKIDINKEVRYKIVGMCLAVNDMLAVVNAFRDYIYHSGTDRFLIGGKVIKDFIEYVHNALYVDYADIDMHLKNDIIIWMSENEHVFCLMNAFSDAFDKYIWDRTDGKVKHAEHGEQVSNFGSVAHNMLFGLIDGDGYSTFNPETYFRTTSLY